MGAAGLVDTGVKLELFKFLGAFDLGIFSRESRLWAGAKFF